MIVVKTTIKRLVLIAIITVRQLLLLLLITLGSSTKIKTEIDIKADVQDSE